MTPNVRAIADRFMYEQATLKHMMALVPDGGFERSVPGTEWTVRQLFAHLARILTTYSDTIREWLAGDDPMASWDPEQVNNTTACAHVDTPADLISAAFAVGLNDLVATLAAVPDGRLAEAFGHATFEETLLEWSEHFLSHAVPLVRALPEVRMDPLVLNWLLDADFDDDELRAWQDTLLAEARAYIATLTLEDEDDDE